MSASDPVIVMLGVGTNFEDKYIRARMLEFLGADVNESMSAEFLASNSADSPDFREYFNTSELDSLLHDGREISRSLWDKQHLILHIDLEYVNFDFPANVYLEPMRAFAAEEPVVDAIEQLALSFGISPLHLLSGRGHHFIWQVHQRSAAFHRLAKLGVVPVPMQHTYAEPQSPTGGVVGLNLGLAYAGAGMVLEFLAQEVLRAAGEFSDVPIEITAVEAGPRDHGREIVSIDISEYGDPLHIRTIRVPFSRYRKHRYPGFGDASTQQMPDFFIIPLHEMNPSEGVLAMRDVNQVLALSRCASVRIPDEDSGTQRLVDAYEQSEVARFHTRFYADSHDPPERWPDTYDRLPLEWLPTCARIALIQPNDLLVRPAAIQHLVRVLLAMGWQPRHIAGLIRSKYERDYGWGDYWYIHNATARADFYTRVFAGMIATGVDTLIDFNCRSTQEKGYCPTDACDRNLVFLRNQLYERVQREFGTLVK